MKRLMTVLVVAVLTSFASSLSAQEDPPNILWLTAEDISPTLGSYGDEYAHTPNLDEFAEESVRYTNAFATAPVCSPARSTLISGQYATSLGTQDMRSVLPMPESVQGFPSHLRENGYFTTNKGKTDYNTSSEPRIIEASWDINGKKGHWSKRQDGQPFFSVFNLWASHQSRSMVWPREKFEKKVQSRLDSDEIHDPSKAPVPPYYPDTPIVRKSIARYYDSVTAMDKDFGDYIDQLESDGLLDDTIVFFYGDHGTGAPRHKRALFDTGTKVPLLVRFPEKYQHLAPAEPGETVDRLVSFVDFPATVLSLAGIEVPDHMQGKPFLGEHKTEPRDYVYGHRDRVDEAFDVTRYVRGERYLYIRNYMPHRGWNQPTAWPDKGVFRDAITSLTHPLFLTKYQWNFAGPRRPVEELYDTQADPMNLDNLADSPDHQAILQRMRNEHQEHIQDRLDIGFVPAPQLWTYTDGTTPREAARSGEIPVQRIQEAAEKVGRASEADIRKQLDSDLPSVRYWGAMGLAAVQTISEPSVEKLVESLSDSAISVRVEAAAALAEHRRKMDRALDVLIDTLDNQELTPVLRAMRVIELLGPDAERAVPAVRDLKERVEEIRPPSTPATAVTTGRQDLAMFIRLSIMPFLKRVDQTEWTPLTNGKNLEGWTPKTGGNLDTVDLRVQDGEIHIESTGANVWLSHENEYEDFELRLEAKMPGKNYNSGIAFRAQETGGKPKGFQCELDRYRSGMIYSIGSGWLWPGSGSARKQYKADSFRIGEWNEFRIRVVDDRIRIWINGEQTTDVRSDQFKSGFVSLQHHGSGKTYKFRRVRLREIQE